MGKSLKKIKYLFILGTEAELIKIFPLWWHSKSKEKFEFLFSGQTNLENSFFYKILIKENAKITDVCKFVQLPFLPEKYVFRILAFGLWSLKFFYKLCISLHNRKSSQHRSITLVHGDTVTTVLSAIVAKIFFLEVWHIESCLKSNFIFSPFPEEICRRIVSKISNVRFCSNETAYIRAKTISDHGNIHTITNTINDAIDLLPKLTKLQKEKSLFTPPYCLLIIHRQENLIGDRGRRLIQSVLESLCGINCVFIVHDTTLKYLEIGNFIDELRSEEGLTILKKQPFNKFIDLLSNSKFLLTDSGTNQEECAYMNIPCGLLRDTTERDEGLNKNVFLTERKREKIKYFIENHENFRVQIQQPKVSATRVILDYLEIEKTTYV